MTREPRNQESMHVAFISAGDDRNSSLADSARRVCTRYDIDPDAIGWPHPLGADSAEFVRERIAAASLFIGIYQTDVHAVPLPGANGSPSEINTTAFDLEAACKLLKKRDVLCFVQKGAERSRALEDLLEEHEDRCQVHEFDEQRDLKLILDQVVKAWATDRLPVAEKGPVLSIQVECRDRYGVLARLADRIFRERGNILRAEHRNHLHRSYIRFIARWPPHEQLDPTALRETLARALEEYFGEGDAAVTVTPVVDEEDMVTARTIFRVMFWDGLGVAERLFGVFADERVSIIESQLAAIPASPALGRLDLIVDSDGLPDSTLGLLQDRLKTQPHVFLVERSTERGKWWY